MTLLSDLIVPEAGLVGEVLASMQQLCKGMKEAQPVCQRLLDGLFKIFKRIQRLENKGRVVPKDQYVDLLARNLRFLKRNHIKELVLRIVGYHEMMTELLRLKELVCTLCDELKIDLLDWKAEWEEDCQDQREMLKATVRDNAFVSGELQDPRAHVEALFMLKFEVQKRSGRHSEEAMRLLKSMIATVIQVSKAPEQSLPLWFLPSYEVQFEAEPFGRGSFCTVHHGIWGPGTPVVVKCFLVEDDVIGERAQAKMEQEIDIWHQLSHPNVLPMFGASHVSTVPFIVCEDATSGDLGAFLARSAGNRIHMWRLLYQAGLGLDYIHKAGVVHGNLKLSNILVGTDGRAKLSDFGLSAMQTRSTSLSKTPSSASTKGDLRWRAPECLTRPPTFASDIYSFAMCMVEAVIGEPPFGNVSDDDVCGRLRRGEMADQPDEMSDDGWQLVVAMTNENPTKRLTLPEVVEKLRVLAHPATIAASVFPPTPAVELGTQAQSHQDAAPWKALAVTPYLTASSTIPELIAAIRDEKAAVKAVLLLSRACLLDEKGLSVSTDRAGEK